MVSESTILFLNFQEAIKEFSFTSEEGRLTIAKAELALKKGDIDKAIDMLNEVSPGQPYYFQAHTKMAHIYLREKKDKTMFTTCFKDVVSNNPMADAHSMMGDAYMSIHGNCDQILLLNLYLITIFLISLQILVHRIGGPTHYGYTMSAKPRLLEPSRPALSIILWILPP